MQDNSFSSGEIKSSEKFKKEINNSLLKILEEKCEKLGIVSIGYTKVPKDVFNRKNSLKYSSAIVLTIAISIYDEESSEKAQKLYDEYFDFGSITDELSNYLMSVGFKTQVLHPAESILDFSKLGQDADLGYIGKNGLLITPKLGPRTKISAILTTIENLPWADKNSHQWIGNYCEVCDLCIEGCPETALIVKEDDLAKSDTIDEKCMVGSSQGCTRCIDLCPFFKDGYNEVKESVKE